MIYDLWVYFKVVLILKLPWKGVRPYKAKAKMVTSYLRHFITTLIGSPALSFSRSPLRFKVGVCRVYSGYGVESAPPNSIVISYDKRKGWEWGKRREKIYPARRRKVWKVESEELGARGLSCNYITFTKCRKPISKFNFLYSTVLTQVPRFSGLP